MISNNVNTKKYIENLETQVLSSSATHSIHSKGRLKQEPPQSSFKTIFMEDRDRILQSEAFRRLKHKTQVFLAPSNDLYRTRLTHTLEVSVVARTLARILKLNEDLTEAIAFAHDLGHPPFGHAGEEVLNTLSPKGFDHTQQSLRIVDTIENQGKGLNLSFEVRDGIIKHSKSMGSILFTKDKDKSQTLEGQIVRFADRISYLIHDLDDAVRSKILHEHDIPAHISSVLGMSQSERLHTMITNVFIETHNDTAHITMTPHIAHSSDELKDFLFKNVYQHSQILQQAKKAQELIERLYHFFESSPEIIIEKTQDISYHSEDLHQRIVDYIAMMTDSFALRLCDKYLNLRKWFTLYELE